VPDDPTADPEAQHRRELRRRVHLGEWLRVAEVAQLCRVNRSTVLRWVQRDGLIRYHQSPAGGRSPLTCNPDDVAAILNRLHEEHGGDAAAGR
jgi:transposase